MELGELRGQPANAGSRGKIDKSV